MSDETLVRLAQTIASRRDAAPDTSYTASLLSRGPAKCAEKFGEEAVEAIIAAARGDKENLTDEAADVLYHLLVMLAACEVSYHDVMSRLAAREGTSGHEEKALRKHK